MPELPTAYSATDYYLIRRATRLLEWSLRQARDGRASGARKSLQEATFGVEAISSLSTRERGLRLCTCVGSACAVLLGMAEQHDSGEVVS